MPGVGGFEAARRMRGKFAERPMQIVALTGWGQERKAANQGGGVQRTLDQAAEPGPIACGRFNLTDPICGLDMAHLNGRFGASDSQRFGSQGVYEPRDRDRSPELQPCTAFV